MTRLPFNYQLVGSRHNWFPTLGANYAETRQYLHSCLSHYHPIPVYLCIMTTLELYNINNIVETLQAGHIDRILFVGLYTCPLVPIFTVGDSLTELGNGCYIRIAPCLTPASYENLFLICHQLGLPGEMVFSEMFNLPIRVRNGLVASALRL